MKIGLILECGPEGPDKKVCERLARKLRPDVRLEFATLSNKPSLIEGCGKAAQQLLAAGCNRVIIVWDLFPAWREKGARPCRAEDRRLILKSLQASDVKPKHVRLVCITEELEAWLLADHAALGQFLSTAAHPIRVSRRRQPERISDPKKVMRKLFNGSRYSDYRDTWHAGQVAELIDVARLRVIESFDRFARFVDGA